jgi:hypothetical protein
MKSRLIFKAVAFLITGLFLFSACNKDQKLIADIEGEYKIESVINYKNGEGTPVIFSGGRIFFQDCKMKDGVGGNCDGWFEFDGKPRVNFQYHTQKQEGKKVINITNLSSLDEPKVMGFFEFRSDGNSMILDGIEQSGAANGVTTTSYSDVKLSK